MSVIESTPIGRVSPGQRMLVRPGERVALDGTVIDGRSAVNQAPITGESVPVEKAAGDEVFAGTINGHGSLLVGVTRRGDDTTLARIIHLVENAQARRAPIQQFIDRFAAWYTPAVVAAAKEGDPLGATLLVEGAEHLIRLGRAVAEGTQGALCLAGGLAEVYRPTLTGRLDVPLLPAETRPDPLRGAWLIATGAAAPEYDDVR